jgi:hypothetical protein
MRIFQVRVQNGCCAVLHNIRNSLCIIKTATQYKMGYIYAATFWGIFKLKMY